MLAGVGRLQSSPVTPLQGKRPRVGNDNLEVTRNLRLLPTRQLRPKVIKADQQMA
jgi:hypothetical protein